MVTLVAVLGRPETEPVLRADPVSVLFAVWPRCPRGGVTPAVTCPGSGLRMLLAPRGWAATAYGKDGPSTESCGP